MLKTRPKWEDEGLTSKEFQERKKELVEMLRKILNDPDFQPVLVSSVMEICAKSSERELIDAFEKKHGKHQNIEGLYFIDLGRKIPNTLLAKAFDDLEDSGEIFQDKFRVEATNVDYTKLFAIKVSA
ncbi:MAG TPA: hypothetical protein P5096_03375 [Patescibacteria group bacterium]|nr:hypothetical protein [Patescibacteria group bacterium]